MDKTRLQELAGVQLNEMGDIGMLADQIYQMVEANVANVAGDEGGYGFSDDAIMSQVDQICQAVKQAINHKIQVSRR